MRGKSTDEVRLTNCIAERAIDSVDSKCLGRSRLKGDFKEAIKDRDSPSKQLLVDSNNLRNVTRPRLVNGLLLAKPPIPALRERRGSFMMESAPNAATKSTKQLIYSSINARTLMGRRKLRKPRGSVRDIKMAAIGPSKFRFFLKGNEKVDKMLNDPHDRRISAICRRFECTVDIYNKRRIAGYFQYIVDIAAENSSSLKACARNLDTSLGWNISPQLVGSSSNLSRKRGTLV